MDGAATIRGVRAHDFEAIAGITNGYIERTPIHFGTEPVQAATLREAWEHTAERYPFVVAQRPGGEVVGFAKAGVWRERSAYAWTPESGVYVDPGEHRRGIGRAMYACLFEIMIRQGYRSVVAGVTLPNGASVRLHESMGFVPQGVIADAGWKFGRWWSVAFFQKMLASGPARPVRPVSEVSRELGLV